MADKIKFPFGAATRLTPPYAATVSVDVFNNKTIIEVAQLTGNSTLQLVPDKEIAVGAEVSVRFTADGSNRTVSLGSNLQGQSIAVNATKIVSATFEWDGLKFVHRGTTALN